MIEKTRQTAAYRREASRQKRLLTDGFVIEGTLAEVWAGSAVHYQLTRKVKGRTQTDYVPLSMRADVEKWTRRWKEAKAKTRDFLRPFRELLNPLLVGLLPKEDEDRCVYSTITLFWTVVIGFVEHLHSRNQMDMARNGRAYSQTWHNRFRRVDSVRLENALLGLVRHLIRGKWFESARVCRCLAVAVDGTLQEKIRSADLSEREKNRFSLEARIITPWGWNIPVLFESVAPYESELEKQDCELNAFKRLAKPSSAGDGVGGTSRTASIPRSTVDSDSSTRSATMRRRATTCTS